MPRPLAAIDIGTNSVLMLVARPLGTGAFAVVDDRAVITRLGRGVDAEGRLARDPMATTLAALHGFAARAHELGADVRAVGTSAVRDAANRELFLAPAARVLGVPVEIVTGEREAALTFSGAMHGLDVAPNATLVDIGGGSTELARRVGSALVCESLDIGSVRLSERHALTAPTPASQLAGLRADVLAALARSRVAPVAPLVAVAGTATTLAAIVRAVARYDPARIHGATLPRTVIDATLTRLAAMSLDERRRVPGLSPGREDLIVAGAQILVCICDAARAECVTISDGGLRVGLILEMLARRPD